MLIRNLLKELLPKLYNETRVRPDLIREVEMGPFKHTVDGEQFNLDGWHTIFSRL